MNTKKIKINRGDKMKAVSITNRGGRTHNEDCVGYAHTEGIWCFVLCDGLGGHSCGEIASKIVCDAVLEAFKKKPEISPCALRNYLEKAACILGEERENDDKKYNMSSTAVVLVTDGKKAVYAHAGDSRLYYISSDGISAVTSDHSIAFMEYEQGRITYDDIRKSSNQNRLTRCINDIYGFAPDISEVIELNNNDAFLMCSDGFWEYVNEENIQTAFRTSYSPKSWLRKMLLYLHENEIEKNDTYSAITVMV